MIKPIVMWPDPLLRQKSTTVENIHSEQMQELVKDMIDTMRAARGVGLSAIQIGVPLRVFVLEVEPGKTQVYFNPSLVTGGLNRKIFEGCLSLPGIFEYVPRFETTKVLHDAYSTADGAIKISVSQLTGLGAQAAQHEYDHLEGKMFADDMPSLKQKILTMQLKRGW